jgi:phospholipase/lecithinase/hemolysin
MRTIGLAALAGAALVLGGAAQAATLTHYTSAWFFGDSLTDPGNHFAATDGADPPSPPYFEGRSSNGPVWAEHVAAGFAAKGLATGNFAFVGAHAMENDDGAFQIPDLPDQLARFASTDPRGLGDRPVGLLWVGANDVIGAIERAPTPEAVATAAAGAAGAVANGIGTLRGLGVRDVVVMNLPGLEMTPAFTIGAPEAAPLAGLGSDVFNATLAALIADLPGARRITLIDMEATFADLNANPGKYGVENATIPCIIPGLPICGPDLADKLAFYDLLHPNRVIHAEIADLVGAEVAPVPLPAPALLLVAGLAAIGLARRRAARPPSLDQR